MREHGIKVSVRKKAERHEQELAHCWLSPRRSDESLLAEHQRDRNAPHHSSPYVRCANISRNDKYPLNSSHPSSAEYQRKVLPSFTGGVYRFRVDAWKVRRTYASNTPQIGAQLTCHLLIRDNAPSAFSPTYPSLLPSCGPAAGGTM